MNNRLKKLKKIVETITYSDLIIPLSDSPDDGLFNLSKYLKNTRLLHYQYSDEYIKNIVEGYKIGDKRLKIEDILEEIKQKDIEYYTNLKNKVWEFVK